MWGFWGLDVQDCRVLLGTSGSSCRPKLVVGRSTGRGNSASSRPLCFMGRGFWNTGAEMCFVYWSGFISAAFVSASFYQFTVYSLQACSGKKNHFLVSVLKELLQIIRNEQYRERVRLKKCPG